MTLQISAVLTGLIAVMALPLAARSYQANLNESNWYSEGDKFICRLIHLVPLYGQAVFELKASRQGLLTFSMPGRYQPDLNQDIQLFSIAGNWVPGDASRSLFTLGKGSTLQLTGSSARRLLTELEQGRFIRIFFADRDTPSDQLDIGVSPLAFPKAYGEFMTCQANLLPFGFEDIEHSPILFEFDQHQLTSEAIAQLERIAQFIAAQGAYKEIWIDGHTDNKGTDVYNDKLGALRAQTIKEALLQRGISEDKLIVKSFGEARPVKPNRSAKGRAQNRRVEVRVVRDTSGL